MDEDVLNPRQFLLDGGFDFAGDEVGVSHAEVGVDLQMEVDVILQAGFSGVTLFNCAGSGDLEGDVADGAEFVVVGHCVHELDSSFPDDLSAEEADDEADGDSAQVIGFDEANGIVEGEAEGGESDGAGEDIDEIVLPVGEEGSAAEVFAEMEFGPGEGGFCGDGDDDGPNGPRFGRRFGDADLAPAPPADGDAGSGENAAHGEAGEDFKAAVAVGVVLVGWARGDREAEPDETAADDVSGRFEAVGEDGGGMGMGANDDFEDRQQSADRHSGEGEASRELVGGLHGLLDDQEQVFGIDLLTGVD